MREKKRKRETDRDIKRKEGEIIKRKIGERKKGKNQIKIDLLKNDQLCSESMKSLNYFIILMQKNSSAIQK